MNQARMLKYLANAYYLSTNGSFAMDDEFKFVNTGQGLILCCYL